MEFLLIDWAAALNVAGFAFLMVFLLLIFIVLVLSISGRFFVGLEKAKKLQLEKQAKATGPVVELAESDADALVISGEVLAVISMTVRAHFKIKHDVESNIITIEKGEKRYSPWSSKIYGLNMFHRN
jgi:Na+-transporting methylmalonyl-CoA/oxaloacetate decarboxylase gamma subunit